MTEIDALKETINGRNRLTHGVAIFSAVFLFIITIAGIILIIRNDSKFDEQNAAMQNLYSTFLPLISTWMGAIIAFYFGKENFETANRNVQAMVQKIITSEDKLKSIKVSDDGVMISINNIIDNKSIRTKTDSTISVEGDLLGFFEKNKNIERLPIMDDKYVIRYLLHKSLITDFGLAFQRGKITIRTLTPSQLNQVTLEDLINNSNDEYRLSVTKSAEFVAKDASLLEAQIKINISKYCQDVFVTDDGSPNKSVIGWITNNRINELGRV